MVSVDLRPECKPMPTVFTAAAMVFCFNILIKQMKKA
jgi:hypothetical protein